MTSITANPRWYFHCHASEAQSLGMQRDRSQLDGISLSGAQLRHSSHLTHDDLQTQREEQFKQDVMVGPSSYLASRAWAKLQRQVETAEASFPGKDTKNINIRQSSNQGRRRKMGEKMFLLKEDVKSSCLPKSDILCLMSAASLQKRLNMGHEIRKMLEYVFFVRKIGSKENLDQTLQGDCELLYATLSVTLQILQTWQSFLFPCWRHGLFFHLGILRRTENIDSGSSYTLLKEVE